MGEIKKKSPFLLEKPSGALPERDKKHNRLLSLNNKMKEQLNSIKKGR